MVTPDRDGQLRDKAVNPGTAARYGQAFGGWTAWLAERGAAGAEDLSLREVDKQLAAYLQSLYQGGAPKSTAVAVICAVQHFRPECRGHLSTAWRHLRAWLHEEPGKCRTPWPAQLTLAMIALAIMLQQEEVILLLALGFHCLLRPGEVFKLLVGDILIPDFQLWQTSVLGVISIRDPKTRRRGPKRQHVTIENQELLMWLKAYLADRAPEEPLIRDKRALQKLIGTWLTQLLGTHHSYTLAGLRGGGATFLYLLTQNVPWIQRRGRWSSSRTLDHYLSEAATLISMTSWTLEAQRKVATLASRAPDFLARV